MIRISDLSYLDASPTANVHGSRGWGSSPSSSFYSTLLKYSRLGRTATATATSLALSNTSQPTATLTNSSAVAITDDTGSYSSSSSLAAITPAAHYYG